MFSHLHEGRYSATIDTSTDSSMDQEVAYILLVELMAYQFASPVQWIQSQESILTDQLCERVIEIGPSSTLTSMLKKTLTSKREAFDRSNLIERQFLSVNQDAKDIFYHVDLPEPVPEVTKCIKSTPSTSKDLNTLLASSTPAAAQASINEGAFEPTVVVEDKPVTVSQIVRCIISRKLQKLPQNINWDDSIKSLVGGRSTLENEIVGDLASEFGASFKGKLGKESSQLVSRMISSKMPGGFNPSAAKKYLESRWHLGPGCQDGALLVAVTSQPSSRLTSESAAHDFLGAAAKDFAVAQGLILSIPHPARGETGLHISAIDPKALEELTQSQVALSRMQLEALAKSLNVDLYAAEKISVTSHQEMEVLQSQLDLWHAEHGDFYASAIKPLFDILKIRTYSSYWNWVVQDVLTLYHDVASGKLDITDSTVRETYVCIVGRADQRLLNTIQFLIDTCGDCKIKADAALKEFLERLLLDCQSSLSLDPHFKTMSKVNAPRTSVDEKGAIQYTEVPRFHNPHITSFVQEAISSNRLLSPSNIGERHIRGLGKNLDYPVTPIIFMKSHRDGRNYDHNVTSSYLQCLTDGALNGVTFQKKNVLLTGAGSGSIGEKLLVGLLAGGARVVVTTSSFSHTVAKFYQSIYARFGARESKLVVVPFNQGSRQDIEALTNYIYDSAGLGWDIDHIIPFAAISEHEREIDSIDSKSEFAHRLMLTNTIRILGSIKRCKQKYGSRNRPAQVILPLSANHGIFGNDGLYSESKSALESLFNRWHSESWSGYLSICGASIGWTRGTNLMASNDWLSEDIERTAGVRTFSQEEMAFAILCLMTPGMTRHCDHEPQFADLNGGLGNVPDFKTVIDEIRTAINSQGRANQAIAEQDAIEDRITNGDPSLRRPAVVKPCPSVRMGFPPLPAFDIEILPLQTKLQGMVDLERVIVISGFSETGPHGNARTRWELEAYGEFSIEGCIEMAWIMGLIKYHNGPAKDGILHIGWVDTKTNEPVQNTAIKSRYEKYILEHTGIRVVEPELLDGYDPQKKTMLNEVVIEEDLKPIETSKALADDLKRLHGDKVDVFPLAGSDEYIVKIKAGATLMIPKAMRFDNAVAGLIPTGWDARTYGINKDIITQVDNVTLYVLVSTIEALLSSGITDPYEIYQYIHVSEIGNCIGSGLGGMRSQNKMFYGRIVENQVQQDILQETFINTTAAWVNMLLMSSSGPIRTPVGACATSIESVELGFDTIISGKAKFCLVGGFDDMTAAVNFEFANMKATANADKELAKGRIPEEMSRPATTTRSGFVESQGAGLQVLTTAKLALQMGLPVYGIVAWSGTASDKTGRSVPAPGNGILTNARESVSGLPSPLLDIQMRRRRLELRRSQIHEYQDVELAQLEEHVKLIRLQDPSQNPSEFRAFRKQYIEMETARQEKEALNSLGNQFWHDDPRISPIRGALATWNLTIDDLDVVSMHGTSTVMNEKNETEVLQRQLCHLGRAKGNTIYAVTQKYLTGHSKGAAGAWMLNGALQILETGLIPGNRNADDIDEALRKHEHVLFPNRSIQTNGVNAISITSFGFGQKGAQAIVVHPKYLFATITKEDFEEYGRKRDIRQKKARRYFHEGMASNNMFVAKESPAHSEELRVNVLLDPTARLGADGRTRFGDEERISRGSK